jgi:hypothetical protein
MIKLVTALTFVLFGIFVAVSAHASNVSVTNYAVTSVNSVSYTSVIASTPITVSQIYVCDTSGQINKIAVGNPANNAVAPTDILNAPVSTCALFPINPYLPAGSSVAVKGAGIVNPTSGALSISLLP